MILFPFAIFAYIKFGQLYDFQNASTLHKFGYWYIFVCFIFIYCLNVFWYTLILKIAVKKTKKNNDPASEGLDEFIKYNPQPEDDQQNKLLNDERI